MGEYPKIAGRHVRGAGQADQSWISITEETGQQAGALNLPHDQVAALAPKLLPNKAAQIVVYCANAACQNSAVAGQALRDLGYSNVREYNEGKADWIEAGFTTESQAGESLVGESRANAAE